LGFHTTQKVNFSSTHNYSINDWTSRDNNSQSQILEVPIGNQSRNEFFLIANRQMESYYDKIMWGDTAHDNPYRSINSEYGKGIYIYHTYPGYIGQGYQWQVPIDQECADGLWNWVQDGTQTPDWSSTQQIEYFKKGSVSYNQNDPGGTPFTGANGRDGKSLTVWSSAYGTDMYNWFGTGKKEYPVGQGGDGTDRLFTNNEEVWTSREWKGDRWDAWRVGYNEVFSPYSSPSTVNWDNENSGIFIYLNSMSGNTANLEVYKVGEGGWDLEEILEATPPSKPMLYRPVEIASCNGTFGYPKIVWDNNIEPDMLRSGSRDEFKRYKIYRAVSHYSGVAPLTYTYLNTYDDYTPGDTASFIDNNVLNGTIIYCGLGGQTNNDTYYRYKIVAVDKYDDESVPSDFVSIRGHSIIPDSPNFTTNENPLSFALLQNYPNPFNPSTEIKFELPQNTFVTLMVYNAVGQVVAELVNNEYRNAGRYSVSFDGTKLASGIYFYSIEAGVYKDVKKMVLIK
jgi:hypothetical protein